MSSSIAFLAAIFTFSKSISSDLIPKAILFVIAAFFLIELILNENVFYTWLAVLAGAVGGVLIGLITEYYTGSTPVEKIAKSGETGPVSYTHLTLPTKRIV